MGVQRADVESLPPFEKVAADCKGSRKHTPRSANIIELILRISGKRNSRTNTRSPRILMGQKITGTNHCADHVDQGV